MGRRRSRPRTEARERTRGCLLSAAATELLELAVADARVGLAPGVGGAITSLTFGGLDVLRPASADALDRRDVRGLACYPLVPYSNRIADARLEFAGRTYALARNFGNHPHAIHGVGWQRAWSVETCTAAGARLALVHDASDPSAWPWPFRATQVFTLAADALHVTLTIESGADEPFPFGLGWHPYFMKADDARLRFAAASVWQNGPTQLPVTRTAIPAGWLFDTPRPLSGTVLDNVFNDWTGDAQLSRPGGPLVSLAADRACDRLVVYAPPGSAFVCLEPVTHETDAFNRTARGADNTGMRVLGPGEAFSCTMRLTVAREP